ncbi:MAG: hypothetical protein ABSD92_11315 [Candidatus Bathyarchaeia archaeon]
MDRGNRRGCGTCSEYNASYSICSDEDVGGQKNPFLTYVSCPKWHKLEPQREN